MLNRTIVALSILAVLALGASAEDAKRDYDAKIEGDSAENVKIKIVANKPADQTSARATVETYNRLLGFIGDLFFYEEYREFKEKAEAIGEKVERRVCGTIITEACLDEMSLLRKKQEAERKEKEAADIKDGMTPRRRIPAKVTGEKTDGAHTVIEVEEGSEYSMKNRDGKWETKSTINQLRFYCAAKDGVWQIDRAEKFATDYSGKPDKDGKYPQLWKEEKIMAGMLGFFARPANLAPVAPEIDTPEKLARAAITWLGEARRASTDGLAQNLYGQVLDLFKPLFSERNLKDSMAEAEKQGAEEAKRWEQEAKEDAERKITIKEAEGGWLAIIAARGKWSPEIVLTIAKTDKGLCISKAALRRMETKYDDKGNATETEKLEPFNSPSQFDWN